MDSREKFIEIAKNNIKREGIANLLNYLEKSDFYVAPASTKFHSACQGGLCQHSINTYNRFLNNLKNEYGDDWQNKISLESATIISLFHDICKTDYYKIEYRNVKENGDWVQKPFYSVDDTLPYGHGEKSVYIISGFLKLTREEAMAINWHMGGFDDSVRGGSRAMGEAFYQYPLAVKLHLADLTATYLLERGTSNVPR